MRFFLPKPFPFCSNFTTFRFSESSDRLPGPRKLPRTALEMAPIASGRWSSPPTDILSPACLWAAVCSPSGPSPGTPAAPGPAQRRPVCGRWEVVCRPLGSGKLPILSFFGGGGYPQSLASRESMHTARLSALVPLAWKTTHLTHSVRTHRLLICSCCRE